jgi:hypothetical protein
MLERLDPVTVGVATALKSLRTRTGLREDRLADTGITVDALVGLTTVRQLVTSGVSTEEAIVRTVRDAATTLDATDSIVADVVLGLGLQPEPLPDLELYASDLGQRRVALRRNWRRLHELRSTSWDGNVPSQRAIRFEVETQALNALASALTADDGAVPVVLGAPVAAAHKPVEPVPLLSEEFRRIAAALRGALAVHPDGMGWARDLRKNSLRPTPVSTSYALQTIILLEGYLAADLVPVVDFLRKAAPPGGGYAAVTQGVPRPEGTATVLDVLHKVDGTEPFTAHIASMKQGLGAFERTRPFVLSRILETSARSGRDLDLIRTVTTDLLDARLPFGGRWLWAQKAEDDLVDPKPSTVHTALAVRALGLASESFDPDDELHVQVHEALADAGDWLAEGQSLDSTSEVIDRQLGIRVEMVYEGHFTAAWVVKALVSLGLPATHPAVSAAVRRVWQDYHRETALWRWSNGDLPVWMTFDAVEALYLAAFAVPVP